MSNGKEEREILRYPEVLKLAHEQGLKRITTTLLQIPTPENGNVCIVAAEVETERGIFSDIGDASPGSVTKMILPHMIRMAATRAKARALKDAVNRGEPVLEEMADPDDLSHRVQPEQVRPETAVTVRRVDEVRETPRAVTPPGAGDTKEREQSLVTAIKNLATDIEEQTGTPRKDLADEWSAALKTNRAWMSEDEANLRRIFDWCQVYLTKNKKPAGSRRQGAQA